MRGSVAPADRNIMNYQCPVCATSDMPYPPRDYSICYCCGTEFGLDDDMYSPQELRDLWLEGGGCWFSTVEPYVQPINWNAWDQLDLAGFSYSVPAPEPSVKTDFTSVGQLLFCSEEPEPCMAYVA